MSRVTASLRSSGPTKKKKTELVEDCRLWSLFMFSCIVSETKDVQGLGFFFYVLTYSEQHQKIGALWVFFITIVSF